MSDSEKISNVHARQVLDSRGNPTVEAEVHCQGGAWGRAIVPSGASTGRHEMVELRDEDPAHFGGRGVRIALANVRALIAPKLIGKPASAQREIDNLLIQLDGTANKSRLGANAILGVSLACAHAAAAARRVPLWQYLAGPNNNVDEASLLRRNKERSKDASSTAITPVLPLPMINLISGGLHAGGNLEFQDFLLLPIGARSYSEALEMTIAVYRALSAVLIQHGFEGVLVGDEGGFGPKLASNEQAIELILQALGRCGLLPGRDAAIALDVASTHFFEDGVYRLRDKSLSADEMIDRLAKLVDQYPILSIEDGLAEDDWDGWKKLTARLGAKVQLIGDDLFVTNAVRLRRGIHEKVANSILIKVNQIGTLTETLDVIALARSAGYRPVISARSGETEDTTIADLAVATGAGQIKIGSVARSERLAKYNQLLRIEEELGPNGAFAHWRPLG